MRMRPVIIAGVSLSGESLGKVVDYLQKYGEFEAYNMFGGKTVEQGVKRMAMFYKKYPEAPV